MYEASLKTPLSPIRAHETLFFSEGEGYLQEVDLDEENSCVHITTMVKTNAKTGVEMEALTGASVAALTVYDMCKAVDRSMNFRVWLASKSGGRSGNFVFDAPPRESTT
ncbi:MAG: hypothetical protein CL713_00530 [Chloroflexi bacterium]|nr:hypothetical protein [Chloroflexota bacterium]